MKCLVLNSGSSSIKFSIYECSGERDPVPALDGQLAGIGTPSPTFDDQPADAQPIDAPTPQAAIQLVLARIANQPIDAVGYRVVHPGPHIDKHCRITPQVLTQLEAAIPFAPLHDPDALALIRATMSHLPSLPHFACFDTVFHQTMPEAATTYPIPLAFRDQGVRRYGFHGLSCESVVYQLRRTPTIPFPQRMVIAHLGSGCSVTALLDGQSIDTSMGLTPTGGIVMGTRPGDLDPGLIFYLLRQPGATIDSVEHMLNHDSGLKALFGLNDMRQLRQASAAPHPDPGAALALRIFTDSLRRTIAGMAALHGMDALVFTGGIGEHDPLTRAAVQVEVPVHVIPAEEDLMIARHVARLCESL